MSRGIRKGFSKPYVAPYDKTAGTYTAGTTLARGVSVSGDITVTEPENWYADNIIAETSSPRFSEGTLTVTCDDPSEDALAMLFTTTYDTTNPTKYNMSDTANTVGFGYIVEKQYQGTTFFEFVIFPCVRFSMPSETAETEADSITWTTLELEASIDTDKDGNYKITPPKGVTYTTEARAVTAMQALMA